MLFLDFCFVIGNDFCVIVDIEIKRGNLIYGLMEYLMSFVFSGKLVVLWIVGKFEGLFSIYIIIKIILYSSFIDIFMFFGVFF